MKTFLKVLLCALVAALTLRLLPRALVFGVVLAAIAGAVALAGFSVLAAIIGVALAFIVLLAPVWMPVLAVVGAVALIKKSGAKSA